MKTLLTFLFLALPCVAQLKISQYPNTNNLADNQLFIVTAGGTNQNITYAQLKTLNTNAVKTMLSNGVNIISSDVVQSPLFEIGNVTATNNITAGGRIGVNTNLPQYGIHVESDGMFRGTNYSFGHGATPFINHIVMVGTDYPYISTNTGWDLMDDASMFGLAVFPSLRSSGDTAKGVYGIIASVQAQAHGGTRYFNSVHSISARAPTTNGSPTQAVVADAITLYADQPTVGTNANWALWVAGKQHTEDVADFAGTVYLASLYDTFVGVRTTNPVTRMQVSLSNELAHFGSDKILASGKYAGIGLGYAETGPSFLKTAIVQEQTGDGNARGKLHLLNNNDASIANATLADARLTILADGKVGVARVDPEYPLDVRGTLRVSEGVDSLATNLFVASTGIGKVGIGTDTPRTRLDIRDADQTVLYDAANLEIWTTNTAAINKGGSIALGGRYNGDAASWNFAAIKGAKENATANNGSGYLSLQAADDSALMREGIRITSALNVGIQTNAPAAALHVGNGGSAIVDGNLTVKGNPVGLFGSLMMNATNIVVCTGAAGVYTNVAGTGFTTITTNSGFYGGIVGNSAALTNIVAGYYRVTVNASSQGANAQATEWEVFTNNVSCDLISFKKTFDNPARMTSSSATGIIYLPAGCRTDFRVQDGGTAGSIAIHRAAITIGTP